MSANDPTTPPDAPVGAANAALDFVEDGMTLGLGTGRAAAAFVDALGARVAAGLRVTGVPTSEATAAQATRLGIPLTRLEDVDLLDVTFDGADEVDPALDLIKGYGAAMVREKIVAESSKKLVILVGPEKLVSKIGERGRLPIEVLPFGEALVRRELARLGLDADPAHGLERRHAHHRQRQPRARREAHTRARRRRVTRRGRARTATRLDARRPRHGLLPRNGGRGPDRQRRGRRDPAPLSPGIRTCTSAACTRETRASARSGAVSAGKAHAFPLNRVDCAAEPPDAQASLLRPVQR